MVYEYSLTDIKSLISTSPLKGLELILEKNTNEYSDTGSSEIFQELVSLFILNLCEKSTTQGYEEQEAVALLQSQDILAHRNIISICLARILAYDSASWLLENPWRQPTIFLFDEEFKDIYRERKVDNNLMSHEKIVKFRDVVLENERQFNTALSLLTSLDQINSQRQRLMKALKNKVSQALFTVFLPDEFEAQLSEAYQRAEYYLEKRNSPSIVDAFSSSKEKLVEISSIFREKNTIYSRSIANRVIEKLFSLMEEDFYDNPAAQPASLSIETRDSKKYSFHILEQTINLGFVIKGQGAGYAHDAKLNIICDDCIDILSTEQMIGRIAPGTSHVVEIPAITVKATEKVNLLIELSWRNFDDTTSNIEEEFSIEAQRNDIDWEEIALTDPYSLEPVFKEQDLVGRRDLLNRLFATIKAQSVGSAIIRGQKRVGKTSIARALQSKLEKDGYVIIFLEAGDYVEADPAKTVARLGNTLCKKIRASEPRINGVNIPTFVDALAPITEYLDDISLILNQKRIVFILDEFDELPLDLYSRGSVGDSFFLTLRSISSRINVGFILVGSEKINHVLDCQGHNLNKWNTFQVDYFTRENDWSDFKELVQRPTNNVLEFTDNALFELHKSTSGNPYFTKLVCNEAFQKAVRRRDCHITRTEIGKAFDIAVRETDQKAFQHFWEDGISERGVKAAEKSIRRRKILISISDVIISQKKATKNSIAEHPISRNITSLDADLKEFVTRKILISKSEDSFVFKVPLFAKWLQGKGVEDIISTFSDLDAALQERQKEEEIKVQYSEIKNLIATWSPYKGQIITEDKVKCWLEQFGGIKEQRIIFSLLKGIKFYSNIYVRKKMSEIHDVVKRGLVQTIDSRKTKRADILVSYLDSPAKSGADVARLYVDESSVYVGNVVEKGKLREVLENNPDIKALLFIDDFVGTGQSAINYLKEIDDIISDLVLNRNIRVVFASVTAFNGGWKKLENAASTLKMPIRLHICECFDESSQCFHEKSAFFDDSFIREEARKISMHYGSRLEKNCPLGFGNLELVLVFERGCPNNTLPILWSESNAPDFKWMPLFKRL